MLTGPLAPGRYFIDAQGNAGFEGGSTMVNLMDLARRRGGGGARGWAGPGGGRRGRAGCFARRRPDAHGDTHAHRRAIADG